jgi:hypothetical protein
MNTIRRVWGFTLILFPLFWLTPLSAQSAGDPDLSGTWRMNSTKSKLPKASKAGSQTIVIKQNGLAIEFHHDVDGKQSVENFTADKKEKLVREVPEAGSKIVVKAYWKGRTFITESKAVFSMSSPLGAHEMMDTKDSWTISSDGLVLTEKTQWDNGQSETVYDKQ